MRNLGGTALLICFIFAMSVGLVDVRIHVRWRAWAERVSNVFGVPLMGHCLTSFRLNLVYVHGFI